MKRKFAKVLAVACALSMALGASAFAAPSTSSDTTDTTDAQKPAESYSEGVTVGKITVNGQEVTPTVKPATNAQVAAAKEEAKNLVAATATVLKAFDITLPEGDYSAGVKVTIGVPEVKAGQKIAVLHQKADGTWEKLAVNEVANGSVTATFYSFSPVAIVLESPEPAQAPDQTQTPAPTPAGDTPKSPKTGSDFPAALAVSVLALAGAAICGKKYVLQQ